MHGCTRLIDRATRGGVADEESYPVSISGDGRFVTFRSAADNLPGGDGRHAQIYLRDRRRRTTRLVSRNSAGEPQNRDAYSGLVTAGGRYVVFSADGTNLSGGGHRREEIHVRDMRKHTTRLVSKTPGGDPAESTYTPAESVSLDGRWVGFFSAALNLPGRSREPRVFRLGPIR